MQKTLRLIAVVLFVVATAAVASTPKHTSSQFGEGSGPTPMCWPGTSCN